MKNYYLDKEGKRHYFKTCVLCLRCIKDPSDLDRIKVALNVLSELNGKPFTKSTCGETDYRYIHKSCLKKIDKPILRRLLIQDWTHRLLNVDNGVWVELDEYGKPKWDTLYSDEEDLDKRLQELKKKGLKNLSVEEKAWLRGIMN